MIFTSSGRSLIDCYCETASAFIADHCQEVTSDHNNRCGVLGLRSTLAEMAYIFVDTLFMAGLFRWGYTEALAERALRWLNDVSQFGSLCTEHQYFTYRVLESTGLFSHREMQVLLRRKFIHREGYLDIDFVLLRSQSRLSVGVLSFGIVLLLVLVTQSELTSTLSALGYGNPLLILVMLLLLLVAIECAFLVSMLERVMFEGGILPLTVATTIYQNRHFIEGLGPRCVFICDGNSRFG